MIGVALKSLSQRAFSGASGDVFRGTLVLLAGGAMGRFIGIAAIPVLTRIYAPEDFGVLAIFTALVAILSPLVTLRYVLALPLPRHDGMAANLLVLSSLLMAGISVLLTIIMWVLGQPLFALFSMESLAPWWWLVALGVFATAFYEMLTLWATRERNYRAIATTTVWQNLLGSVVKIGLGLLALKPGGLLIGQVIAQSSGIGSLLRMFGPSAVRNRRHVRWGRVWRAARTYKGFPAWRVPSQILMVIAQQAPLLFVAYAFNASTTGQLSLALTGLALPLSLLGNAAGRALYAEASRERRSERISEMAWDTQRRLFFVAILPTAALLFGGDHLFAFVFGNEWREAGQYAQILSVSLLFQFSSAPLVQLMNIFSKQSIFLMINLGRIVLLVVAFIVVVQSGFDSHGFVIIYSVTMCIFYIVMTLVVFKSIAHDLRKAANEK